MAIYTKKAPKAWIKAFQKFESISGFEVMRQEEIDSGEATCREVWEYNIRWLEDVVADTSNIRTPCDD